MENAIHNIEIILVEDSLEDANLVIRSLKKNNLSNSIIHLKDGAEALDFIFANGEYAGRKIEDKPKLILLDLKMPKVDGLQVLRALKTDDRTQSIPVVIMTSSREDRDLVESYKLGVNGYVVKPVSFENFAKAVAELGMFWLLINQSPR
ncbi:MAG: response regulator [Bacteroidota bacterium]|nr:response regulator [Bacteroidota bacterium]